MKIALLLLALVACGASARQRTVNATFAATNAASSAFATFDRDEQLNIVRAAPDKTTSHASLEAWRARQVEIEQLFAGAYRGIAAAAIADDSPSFQSMVGAALLLSQSLRDLGVIK